MLRNLPNGLSLSRIALAFAIMIFYSRTNSHLFITAIIALSTALATDFMDGEIARRFNLTSEIGYVLDGLGDRAIYVALYLVLHLWHSLNILLVWMLIFREISIYALRLCSDNWFILNRQVRWLSRLHAGSVRIWLLTYLAADGLYFALDLDLYRQSKFRALQASLLIATLFIAYYTLYRHAETLLKTTGKEV